jgi:hypothetical protein
LTVSGYVGAHCLPFTRRTSIPPSPGADKKESRNAGEGAGGREPIFRRRFVQPGPAAEHERPQRTKARAKQPTISGKGPQTATTPTGPRPLITLPLVRPPGCSYTEKGYPGWAPFFD